MQSLDASCDLTFQSDDGRLDRLMMGRWHVNGFPGDSKSGGGGYQTAIRGDVTRDNVGCSYSPAPGLEEGNSLMTLKNGTACRMMSRLDRRNDINPGRGWRLGI